MASQCLTESTQPRCSDPELAASLRAATATATATATSSQACSRALRLPEIIEAIYTQLETVAAPQPDKDALFRHRREIEHVRLNFMLVNKAFAREAVRLKWRTCKPRTGDMAMLLGRIADQQRRQFYANIIVAGVLFARRDGLTISTKKANAAASSALSALRFPTLRCVTIVTGRPDFNTVPPLDGRSVLRVVLSLRRINMIYGGYQFPDEAAVASLLEQISQLFPNATALHIRGCGQVQARKLKEVKLRMTSLETLMLDEHVLVTD
ncbi:hypothetical protein KEM52_002331 [Ascosphaera acerosa]|nr:hypothetical protein KEM52_002331 [Ascosphaera acerosa]